MENKQRKLVPILALFCANGLVYGFNALYYNFIQLYIERYYSGIQSGILLAVGPAVAIFGPLFWGVRADKAKTKNRVLLLCVAMSTVFYFCLMFSHNFIYLFLMLTALMFFMSPFGGLIDIITLEYTADSGVAYGPIRLTGTLVYGIIPMILSNWTEDHFEIVFYAYLVLAAVCIAALLIMPKVEGHASKSKPVSVLPLLRDKRLLILFIAIAMSQFNWAYYLDFYPTYLTDNLGMPHTVWGVCVFMSIVGEIPFFLTFNALFRKFGIKKILFAALAMTVVRYAALAIIGKAVGVQLVALITGFVVTVFTYCGSVYINSSVAPEMKASGQTLMYALCNGIPKVLAAVIGGQLTQFLGVPVMMFVCTALTVIAAVVCLIAFFRDDSPAMN